MGTEVLQRHNQQFGGALSWNMIQVGSKDDTEAAMGYNIVFALRHLPKSVQAPNQVARGGISGAKSRGSRGKNREAHRDARKRLNYPRRCEKAAMVANACEF